MHKYAKIPVSHQTSWFSGNGVAHINEATLRRARLVLGWVTASGFKFRCGTFISVCDQKPRSTQPGHPFMGRRNEYQPKGGYALLLGSNAGMIRVWNCVIPLLHTNGPQVLFQDLRRDEIRGWWWWWWWWAIPERFRDKGFIIKRFINSAVYFTSLYQNSKCLLQYRCCIWELCILVPFHVRCLIFLLRDSTLLLNILLEI